MGQRIQTGGRRQEGRHAHGQLGIEQRQVGHDVVVGVVHLLVRLVILDHRVLGHFAAGAGGGRGCPMRPLPAPQPPRALVPPPRPTLPPPHPPPPPSPTPP